MTDEPKRQKPKQHTLRRFGRPPKYRPEYAERAKVLCAGGATNPDLALEFKVDRSTINSWIMEYPEFHTAVMAYKETADDIIERSQFESAKGYSYKAEKVFHNDGDIVRVEVMEHVPPDPGAGKNWLVNRGRWREEATIVHQLPSMREVAKAMKEIEDEL